MEKLSQHPGGSVSATKLPADKHTERRRDLSLRSAVNSIQDLLFDIDLEQRLYRTVLEQILVLTDSTIGASVRVESANGEPSLVTTKVLLSRSADKSQINPLNTAREISLAPLLEFARDYLVTQRTLFFNSEIPDTLLSSFRQLDDNIENALVLPLFVDGELSSLYVAANAPTGYHSSTASRMHPIVAASECVLRTSLRIAPSLPSLSTSISSDPYLCSLMSACSDALLVVDNDGAITTFNPVAEQLLGIDRERHLGAAVSEFLPGYSVLLSWPGKGPEWLNTPSTFEFPSTHEAVAANTADGDVLNLNVTLFRNQRSDATFTTLLLSADRDLLETLQQTDDVAEKFYMLADLAPGGVLEVNEHWECVNANDQWFTLCGLTRSQARELSWYDAIYPADLNTTLGDIEKALAENRPLKKEIRLLTPYGQTRWVEFHARAIRDTNDEVRGFIAFCQDTSERRQINERLRRVAEHDALTGLANRVLFQDRLQQMLVATKRNQKLVALLFIDLDGFKDINDTLGHDAGDILLKHVAKRLVNALRSEDTVARFGGDTFTILLRHVQDGDYVPMVADKIIRAISAPFLVDSHEVFVTTSVGISVGNAIGCDAQTMIKQADIALHKAKAEGRNRFHYFTPEMDQQAHARLNLVNSIHRALDNEEVRLEYQPQASVRSGMLSGFEALLRWRHPDMGSIPPKKFVPVMEECNVIIDIGRWALHQACQQLQQWRREGLVDNRVTMSVNVSARQLTHGDLLTEVKDALNYSELPAENLVLEITESVLINKARSASRQIKKLKTLGVRFALDDFGTGYSSLSYLQKFPIDQIKIDQSFIRDLMKDEQDANITRAIIALAHNLNMTVTAEGVVNEKTLRFLDNENCDHFQGFHLSRSRTADSLTATLKLQRGAISLETRRGAKKSRP